MNISLLIIFFFAVFALYLGIRARKGKNMDMAQFAVGNRGFGPLFVFLLIAGEVYTTFTFLGAAAGPILKGQRPFMYLPIYYWLMFYPIGLYRKFGDMQRKTVLFHSLTILHPNTTAVYWVLL